MIKVIQVGMGGMGNTWLKTVLASKEVEYAGFVEVNPDIAAQQARQHGLKALPVFDSLDKALAILRPDGVIDVTPPRFHSAVSIQALGAGIPVLSEKPLSDTIAGAEAIIRKANQTGVLHMVAQNYRYSAPVQTLKQVLASGALGRIGSVTVEFNKGPHFGGFREGMPYPLIVDMAIHHFDLMRFFLDSDPVWVIGQSWNPPWSWYRGDAAASVALRFANGAAVAYNGSWASNGFETSWNGNWRLECENGVVLLRDDQVIVQRKATDPAEQGGFWQHRYEDPETVPAVSVAREGQGYLLNEFYEAVALGKPPATTCQDNIKSLNIVFDVVRAFETGGAVRRTGIDSAS